MPVTSRRKGEIAHLKYQPARPYPYDLEIFRVSDLKRRTSTQAMRRTYSYEFFMLICVTDGRCVQQVDFEAVPCGPGTFLVLRPGQAHNFGSDEEWDGWTILFRPEFLLPTVPASQELGRVFDLERLPDRLVLEGRELNRTADAILRMSEDSLMDTSSRQGVLPSSRTDLTLQLRADVHALLRCDLYAFLVWLAVVHGRRRTGDPRDPAALQRFSRFQKLVEQRFAVWSQLGDYAKRLGCTEKTLTRATAVAVGMSAKAFISKRINLEAKRLLAHTDLPIGAIAEKLGFPEATHFSKFFRRETSCTPKEFRARRVPVPGHTA